MTPEQEALGRRAVLAVGDNWRAGMRVRVDTHWGRLVACGGHLIHVSEVNASDAGFPPEWEGATVLVNVEDHATLGCITALAREALGEPGAFARAHQPGWSVETEGGYHVLYPDGRFDDWTWGDAIVEPSEPAVWVAALEAAGRRA